MPKVKRYSYEVDPDHIDNVSPDLPNDTFVPERNLLYAILTRCYLDLIESSQLVQSHHRGQAYRWIISPSQEPYSFIWICEELNMDHNVIKLGFLAKWLEHSH